MAFILERGEEETTTVKIRGKINIVPMKSKLWLNFIKVAKNKAKCSVKDGNPTN